MAKAMQKYFRENFDGGWNRESLAQWIFPIYGIYSSFLYTLNFLRGFKGKVTSYTLFTSSIGGGKGG